MSKCLKYPFRFSITTMLALFFLAHYLTRKKPEQTQNDYEHNNASETEAKADVVPLLRPPTRFPDSVPLASSQTSTHLPSEIRASSENHLQSSLCLLFCSSPNPTRLQKLLRGSRALPLLFHARSSPQSRRPSQRRRRQQHGPPPTPRRWPPMHRFLPQNLVPDFENFWSECPWDEDLKYAKAVCDQVQVPLEVVHLTDEYWKNVVSYIIEEYKCGRTPNPDVLCNTRIKFGAFLDTIKNMEFDYVASGHYASVVHSSIDQVDKPSVLELSKDMVKDQTYFLSHLSQDQLKQLIFPLGCIPKSEVRRLATKLDLPNQDRKDSQGICFLGKIKFSEFVARHIGEMEGVMLEAETGDFLGKHCGFWFYTIGQRHGLRLPGGPWYVVEKDVKNNVVFVSRNYFSNDKRRRMFRVGSLKWVSGSPPNQTNQLQCKVRHGPRFYSCTLTINEDVADVLLSEDDQGLAAGQFAAFYEGRTCVGSGVILESWDDQGFPVCARALEIAGMEDKAKLGKPVKIMAQPETPKEPTRSEVLL